MRKLKELNSRQVLILVGIIIMLGVTAFAGVQSFIGKKQQKSLSEVRKELSNTVWLEETSNGTNVVYFSPFGDILLGTKNKKGKLNLNTVYLTYEVTKPNNLYISNQAGNDKGKNWFGDHKIEVNDDTLKLDNKYYKKGKDATGWYDYSQDPANWESFTEEDIYEMDHPNKTDENE